MDVFVKFLYEFMSQFFGGIIKIFTGVFEGITQMFNFSNYASVVNEYSSDFKGGQWLAVAFAIIIMLIVLGLIVFLVVLVLRKYMRIRKSLVEQETLLEELAGLNREVFKLNQEKDRILAMKVSQLGLKPGEDPNIDLSDIEGDKESDLGAEVGPHGASRFFKLTEVDRAYENWKDTTDKYEPELEELVERFINFSGNKLKLFYNKKLISLFVASLGTTRLVILQGISGTGKTSLAYAWGKFLQNDAVIASVQPSWRDRTELFGYFNEFTHKFNETEVLMKMYEANHNDKIYITVLDEMNIARVEYYFAEMLSILEMPSRDEWVVELVPSIWPNDPKGLMEGKLKLPPNMWYIGTINNDDSTFMVTDKVYDRAMPIDINEKGVAFDAPDTPPVDLSARYLETKFQEAIEKYPVSVESLRKLEEMDDYVIKNFRLAFGNRIMKQLKDFVPIYVACGGTEIDGIDYVLSRKILRKFEQLNLSFVKNAIDDYIKYMDKLFGKENMSESKEYLFRLKGMM